jgi:hypothetical protein
MEKTEQLKINRLIDISHVIYKSNKYIPVHNNKYMHYDIIATDDINDGEILIIEHCYNCYCDNNDLLYMIMYNQYAYNIGYPQSKKIWDKEVLTNPDKKLIKGKCDYFRRKFNDSTIIGINSALFNPSDFPASNSLFFVVNVTKGKSDITFVIIIARKKIKKNEKILFSIGSKYLDKSEKINFNSTIFEIVKEIYVTHDITCEPAKKSSLISDIIINKFAFAYQKIDEYFLSTKFKYMYVTHRLYDFLIIITVVDGLTVLCCTNVCKEIIKNTFGYFNKQLVIKIINYAFSEINMIQNNPE